MLEAELALWPVFFHALFIFLLNDRFAARRKSELQ
jgi:hypothetical protein